MFLGIVAQVSLVAILFIYDSDPRFITNAFLWMIHILTIHWSGRYIFGGYFCFNKHTIKTTITKVFKSVIQVDNVKIYH